MAIIPRLEAVTTQNRKTRDLAEFKSAGGGGTVIVKYDRRNRVLKLFVRQRGGNENDLVKSKYLLEVTYKDATFYKEEVKIEYWREPSSFGFSWREFTLRWNDVDIDDVTHLRFYLY